MNLIKSTEIVEMTCVSSRHFRKYRPFMTGFPKPIKRCQKKGYLYNRDEIMTWLKSHNLRDEINKTARELYAKHGREIVKASFNQRCKTFLTMRLV